MNKSFNQPDQLRRHMGELDAEISMAEKQKLIPLRNRLYAAIKVIDQADEVLRKPNNHHVHSEAQEAKSKAYAERSTLAQQVQTEERHIDGVKTRRGELQQRLQRAEYEAVSTGKLAVFLSQHVAAIQAVDSEQDDLTTERDTLQRRRLEAQQAGSAVDTADRELQAARAAHDQAQGDAFISGESVDLSPHANRVAKAEKHLAATEKDAAAGRSALPRISARLAAIEDERVDLNSRRTALLGKYWETRKQMVEIEYREAVQQTIDACCRLAALDGKTDDRLGNELLKGLRDLKRPLNGKHTESVGFVDTDFGDTVAEFEAELSAAIGQL